MRAELATAKESMAVIESEHASLKQLYEAALAKVSAQETLSATIKQLRMESHERSLDLASLQQDYDVQQKELSELRAQLDASSRKATSYQLIIQDLNAELANIRQSNEERRAVIATLEKNLQILKAQKDAEVAAELEVGAEDLDERIDALRMARKHLAESLADAQLQLASVQSDRVLLQTELVCHLLLFVANF